MNKYLLGLVIGAAIGITGFSWYQSTTYKGMWLSNDLITQIPQSVMHLVIDSRFNEIHVQDYDNNDHIYTVLTDCIENTCSLSQSARTMGSEYTGNGFIIARSDKEGLLVFVDGKYTNPGEFRKSVLSKSRHIESAFN